MRTNGMTKAELEIRDDEICKMYFSGATAEQIKEHFKVNDNILKRVLKPYRDLELENEEYTKCREEIQFLNTLDSFCNAVNRINRKAADGASMKEIRSNMLKTVKAYSVLVGIAQEEKKTIKRAGSRAKVVNGWVVCPVCQKKTIRAADNTHFQDLPVFCKRCKKEFISNL